MSILRELNTLIAALGVPAETGVFSGKSPDEYIVITPLSDTFAIFADNHPRFEVQEARLSLFSKGNYTKRKIQLTAALLAADFTITDRRYIGYEADTGYHHLAVDCGKSYSVTHEYGMEES